MARNSSPTLQHQPINAPEATEQGVARDRKRSLTLPLFSTQYKPCIRFKCMGPVVDADMPKLAKNESGTIPIMHVIDLESGEEGLLMLPTVAVSAFQRMSDDPVGLMFELTVGDKVPGKDYRHVELYEIDS